MFQAARVIFLFFGDAQFRLHMHLVNFFSFKNHCAAEKKINAALEINDTVQDLEAQTSSIPTAGNGRALGSVFAEGQQMLCALGAKIFVMCFLFTIICKY